MGLFNFKVVGHKSKEEKELVVSYVKASRKEKTCAVCGKTIEIGKPSATFMKEVKYEDDKKRYITQYTCGNKSPCTKELAKRLNITL